ncbi:zf-HC2 domain-containing protein [Thermopolyspora sp. NPDC052614]|uniref:anti-sigma factor family protein n=1 Tax=Thermopolyspora sp. NPDC052614 TaxID=3155682 RepID=UPI0034374361
MSVDCDDVRMALGAYVLGSLDSREAADVYEHLAWCPFCRVEADEFLGLPDLLGRVTEADIEQAARPPRAVLDRMLKVTTRRRRITQAVLTIAASVVIGVVGGSFWIYTSQQAADTTAVAARPAPAAESAPEAAADSAAARGAKEPTTTITVPPSEKTARELTASDGDVRAVLRLRSGEGGTEVGVSLGGVARGTKCNVIVVAKDGTREQAASWTIRASNGEVASFSGSTAIALDNIRRIDLVTPKGDLLLRVTA